MRRENFVNFQKWCSVPGRIIHCDTHGVTDEPCGLMLVLLPVLLDSFTVEEEDDRNTNVLQIPLYRVVTQGTSISKRGAI